MKAVLSQQDAVIKLQKKRQQTQKLQLRRHAGSMATLRQENRRMTAVIAGSAPVCLFAVYIYSAQSAKGEEEGLKLEAVSMVPCVYCFIQY